MEAEVNITKSDNTIQLVKKDIVKFKIVDEDGQPTGEWLEFDMGDVIKDLAARWQDLTKAQQQAAAVAIGGKMQYSRLIAIMDN